MEKTPLKLLIVEDSEDDLFLLLRALRKSGYEVAYQNVQSAEDLKEALARENWDAIISDYSMPNFTGIEALSIVRQLDYDLPFIIVSGAMGEEIAVQAMRNGAYDYMMKDNLTRLVPALQRSIQEALTRQEQKQREREVEAIATIATALRVANSRQGMLPVLHEEIIKLVPITGIAFVLRTEDPHIMRVELASGAWINWYNLTVPDTDSITGYVTQTYQPFMTNDLENEEKFLYKGHSANVCCAVCVPLIAENQVIGTIWIGRDTPFKQEEVRIIVAISEIAANALHRAQILETLEQRVQERTAELQAMNERLTELDVLKSKFVSDVSHELRTPITSLSIYLGLLAGTENPVKRAQFTDILKKQALRLSQLVDNILDLSRLESNPNDLVFEILQINNLVAEVVTDLAPVAENNNLKIDYQPTDNIPAIVGDYNKLTEVITNLMSNAINYTPHGHITITTRYDSTDSMVEIVVEDTGIGIEPQDLAHLFDRFYRGSTVGQLSIPGSGLGLAIVNEIVKLHHGTIAVESQLKQGSTFTVKLPVASKSS